MSERTRVKRLVVCVDAEEVSADGTLGYGNTSNIFRLKSIIPTAICYDAQGREVEQIVRYCRAVQDGPSLVEKLKGRSSSPYYEQQIKDIVKEACETLEEPTDELFLYGYGRGAFIVRAVAGILGTMRLPKRTSLRHFDTLYKSTLDVFRARHEDDNRNGPRIIEFLTSHTTLPPQIQFVGAFDTVKYTAEGSMHDLSLVGSIRNMRHALALNETRAQLNPEIIQVPASQEMQGRSLVQAWFMGSHQDIGGGARHDGLSLYPLQWMIVESVRAGLIIQSGGEEKKKTEAPLALAFPQYAGDIPKLDGDEKIEWRIRFTNGIQISLYDLQSLHGGSSDEDQTHTVHINSSNMIYNSQRKVFGAKELIGWCDTASYGTIIHPSVFCLLDRYPRFYEQSRFKSMKKNLADYRDRCLQGEEGRLPPWLEGLQLQESGVKAFRILVCGKTGVGKSTLINKIFGVEMVISSQMMASTKRFAADDAVQTEESNSYKQGDHNINQAFESPNHPGLMIHDSRGWQAGSDKELELIAKFLRHRAFQRDPAEALHVIWFCVDSDVSRIEDADKRTFETIAQFSHNVPVFVVGTKKDKLIAYRKIKLLEKYMEQTNNYQESSRLANEEASKLADEQFMALRDELSQIKHYKADGYCCLSKDDDQGVRKLLTQTLELITDDRVRLFCVAAQVVDVEQKIDSAITECMRLGMHAVRTAMVPLPLSSAVGTPTVARILCEHILQCFGFPKAVPDAVEDIMTRIVLGHLKSFMTVTMVEFVGVGVVTAGVVVGTMGAGGALALALCILAAPPTARMLFKCACDMILILERAFRYQGKFVSVKQIEDAALYYTTAMTKTFAGKELLLQKHVHNEVDRLIPLTKLSAGVRFSRLRPGLEEIIYKNRFGKEALGKQQEQDSSSMVPEIGGKEVFELDAAAATAVELDSQKSQIAELPAEVHVPAVAAKDSPKLRSNTSNTTTTDDLLSWDERTSITQTLSDMELKSELSPVSPLSSQANQTTVERVKSENLLARGTRMFSSKFRLKKSKTQV
ncbi:uncharacterized protein Z518_10329 [Rhinocladiella mackenziei CBS 650.93]|uniref:Rhinocladiella mackenziei CBS 650.93 unplaced genomic scaffold supercont1.9, whole genome shotgun sequence n=1 Tax=Rhinocladiella mackenziei CBS 650.93 TaxID=1442369 RepID=A0A0D2IAB7_9EURO|nr:uncharacterized protein Z518_10329 [Rhinocladiella mackenziei CBS 650.93]KIX00191.1 hypothetical protein Z518_10329 [Rhinocladiella mackenziei CBS 650.93]